MLSNVSTDFWKNAEHLVVIQHGPSTSSRSCLP
jgi:hypothetical protein